MSLPPLRYLDIAPIEHEGEPAFVIHDVEGYVDSTAVLSPLALFVATQLDGERDIADIQAVFAEASGGQELPEDHIRQVVEFLDENGYLLSKTYLELRNEVITKFAKAESRPAYLAGKSYPEDADALKKYLDNFFTLKKGPGQPLDVTSGETNGLPGLIVPHIDFDRGGHGYAHGYARLAQSKKPKTVIVFGVAHHAPPVPVILTRKHFETPIGTVRCDTEAVDKLADLCSWDPYEHEILHRTEHSIEFHAVMLAHLYGDDVRIVPILCAHFGDNGRPGPETEAFLDGCREYVQESGGEVAVIAAADLAHVGKRFGDEFDITGSIVQAVEDRDIEDLKFAQTADGPGWYESVMRDENERRVCGINCIYATLRCLDAKSIRGEILNYDYAHDPAGGIVSFTAVAFDHAPAAV